MAKTLSKAFEEARARWTKVDLEAEKEAKPRGRFNVLNMSLDDKGQVRAQASKPMKDHKGNKSEKP